MCTRRPRGCLDCRSSRPTRARLRATVQAKWSTIDFDYLSYAELRWSEYHRRKAEFIAAANAARL